MEISRLSSGESLVCEREYYPMRSLTFSLPYGTYQTKLYPVHASLTLKSNQESVLLQTANHG